MEFDKSRVYTALNADELPIGSKCIFADTIQDLRQKVQGEEAKTYAETLTNLYDDASVERFAAGCFTHIYAYLIEPPTEPKYEPFESIEAAMKAIKAHGGWVRDTMRNRCYAIVAYDEATVETVQDAFGVDALFDSYVFADDGSPCGELVEKTDD